MSIVLPKASSAIQFLLIAALPISAVSAADFTISNASTSTQTLKANNTGNITAAGSLTVNNSDVAITVSGNNATLNNLGLINQTGDGRAIRDNTGVTGLVINNGSTSNASAKIITADADVIQMNKANASVTLNNYGSLVSKNASAGGSQAVDFSAITSGANIVNNYGTLQASEADSVRPGVNGVVNNYGKILSTTSTGSSSDGVDAQNNSGIQVFNYATGLIEGGRHGITGGQVDASTAFTMSVTNAAGGIIQGDNGSGINIDGFNNKQLVTVVNNGSIIGNGVTGDGDGLDVDALVNVTNTGIIRSANAFGDTSEGMSVGGGVITNSGTIEGLVAPGNTSSAVGRGITLSGNDITSGPNAGQREGLYGNATVTNLSGGLIRGQSDSAIVATGLASGYTVTINNNAGAIIRGGGSLNAAIKTGNDKTIIVTGGTIDGSSSGKAIEMGSAQNSLTVTGGSILGSINGGTSGQNTMSFQVGAGNSFSYNGAISNFSKVEVVSGDVTLSGVSSYTGETRLSGGMLTLDGAHRLSDSSALILNGGALRLTNISGANAQAFSSLSLLDNASILLGGSSLTFGALGTVVDGKTLSFTEASSGTYAFRLLGDYSANASFLDLLSETHINGLGVKFNYDGTYTTVSALTAVPEPSAFAMLFAGLGMVGAIARRRRKV